MMTLAIGFWGKEGIFHGKRTPDDDELSNIGRTSEGLTRKL